MNRSRRLTRLLAPLAALALAGAGVFASASAASAHDELVGSDPAAGSTVTSLPAEITLTFSATLLADQGGNQIKVTDSSGGALAYGDLQVVDNTLLQPLTGTPSGEISVVWRAVSSDGHPISGTLSFTVASAPVPTVTQTVTAPPAPAPASPTATPTPVETDSSAVPWLIAAAVAIAAGIVVVIVLATRGRRGETPSGDAPDTDTER